MLLLERPWLDQAVDPRRYRLPPSASPLVKALSRGLPKADVCVELTGDAETINERKPEIGKEEIARQQQEWHDLAPRVARRVVEVDAVAQMVEQSAARIIDALRPPNTIGWATWGAPYGYPSRIGLRVTAAVRPRAALAIYPPQKRAAIVRDRKSVV